MRTTLTLDDDVEKRLRRLQKERGESFKSLVNRALREGLVALEQPRATDAFRTQTVSLGRALVNLDSVADALEVAEGAHHG
ncbi:conserved hypothetical protein [Truepera radiovictrix DSM 17093]|uniref:CopG domain protein DNA-binding domain protein n=1 Tax=Truepera radiovictrix (strain DSM 17093 / CIP 108686 / LMG 22925 / RQ-24) TaxID=649638 RepID=D7CX17_TRURR|nr:conserved hypothetical protein [Truepera radiovictrix DSM 17093]